MVFKQVLYIEGLAAALKIWQHLMEIFLVVLEMLSYVFNRHQTDGQLLSKLYQLYYLSRKH